MQRILWCVAMCLGTTMLVPIDSASAAPSITADPASGRAAVAAPSRPTLLDSACETGDGRLRHSPSGSCGGGASRVRFRADARVATCLLPRSVVRRLGARACEAQRGSTRLLPDNEPVRLCAPRRGGPLRWVRGFGGCRAGEAPRLMRNLPPTSLRLAGRSVTENDAVGTVVGTLRAPDRNLGDRARFTLQRGAGGEGNDRFAIVGNRLVTAAALDHESEPTLRVRIRATDLLGRKRAASFTIAVDDLEENRPPTAISLDSATVAENEPADTRVGALTTQDPDPRDEHTYVLESEEGVADDNAAFRIVDGVLRTAAPFDFETGGPTRSVRVRSRDGQGGSVVQVLQVEVTDANEAPAAVVLAPAVVAENSAGAVVGTLSTRDPDAGDTHTYALVAGPGSTGNALFALSGDQLSTAVPLDFETGPSHSIRVRVTDAAGASFEQALVITVGDGNDGPSGIALSPASVAENRPAGTDVGALSAQDQDPGDRHVFSLVSGPGDTDNASFTITGSRLVTAAPFDYETTASLSVRVRAQDTSGAVVESAVTVTVTNVNEPPSALDLSGSTVAEDRPVGSLVGTLTSTDPDGPDAPTYALVAGPGDTDNAAFEIVGDRLQTASALDFESTTSYTVRVGVQDADGERLERTFTIAVLDRNEAPTSLTLSNDTVAENEPANTDVATLLSTDPDAGDTATYTLVTGPGSGGNSAFVIAGSTLRTTATFDHETVSSYPIRVRVTDAGTPGLSREETFTVRVSDVNESPTGLAVAPATLAENRPAGTTVGTVSAADPEGRPLVYTLVAGSGDTDNARFSLTGDQLVALGSVDFETDPTLSVRVRADDLAGGVLDRALTITIGDVNDAPTSVLLSVDEVDEDAAAGTAIGTLSTTDQDTGDSHTYALAEGAGDDDNARFQVVGDELRTRGGLDAETEPTLRVRISSTDAAGAGVERSFTVTVTDVNEAPTGLSLSSATVPENTASYDVGTLGATDADGLAPYTFALVAGAGDDDNASFAITGSTLRATTAFDFEAGATRTVRVRVTDAGGASLEQSVSITVTDANDAPSAILLTGSTVSENLPAGADVGTLSTTDQDPGDTHAYALVIGPGATGNASFSLTPEGELSTAAPLDYEAWATYSIRVRATDSAGAFVEQALTVTVTNVNEAPSSLDLSATTVAENQPVGTLVGTLSSDDPDLGDSVGFALVAGGGDDDNADFRVDGVRLETAVLLDHEAGDTRSVRLRVSDASGEQVERVFVIAVTDVNEAPTGLTLSSASVPENRASYDVGTLSATDADGLAPYVYELVSGAGDTDNGDFALTGGMLRATTAFDFETGATTRSVRVRVTDAGGASFERTFTITVTDANDAPVGATLSADTIAEDAAPGSTVGTLTTNDPDAGDTHTWSLVAGTGSGDNGSFVLSAAGELSIAVGLDHESDPTLSVRVRATDAGGLFVERALTITVADVNEAPSVVTLSSTAVAEGAPIGTVVGTLSATDPDAGDSVTFSLRAGSSPSLTIVGDELRTTAVLDFDGPDGISGLAALVRARDLAGATTDEDFTVTVTDVNEAPTALTMADHQVDENQPGGTRVGTLAGTDPDPGDTLVYALAAGAGSADNARFTVVAATGEVRTAEELDHEAASTRSIRVKVTDAGGLSLEQQVTIDVGDLNDAPTAASDSYTGVVGNTRARLGTFATTGPTVALTGALPLANDDDQDGDPLEVVAQSNVTTTAGGSVDIAVDGSFRYLPGVGDKDLTDTFVYRVTDGVATAEGTVSLVIADRLVWYVDRDFAGVPDGRSTAPYPALSALSGANGAGDPDGPGDTIFVDSGAYGAGIALEAGQKLVGAGIGLAPGLVAPGAAPVVNPSSGTAVTLSDGSSVDGIDVSVSGSATGLVAGSVATAQVGPDVELRSAGSTGPVVSVTGAAAGDITVDAPITNAGTGLAVRVEGRTGGKVAFAQPVTTSGTGARGGISLGSNTGAAVSFGHVALATGNLAGLSATSGGTVSVSDPTSTISTGTGAPLRVRDTTIGSAFTFRSISAAGASSGIELVNTGSSGRLVVTGNSGGACGGTVDASGVVTQTPVPADCSGGTIANTTGPGVVLSNTQGPALTRMWIHHGQSDGILANGVTGGLTLAHSLIEANGDAAHENGVDLGDSLSPAPQGVTGTTAITSSTVRGSADSNVVLGNSSGAATLNITGSQISGAGASGTVQDGVLVRALGTASVATEIRANSFAGNRGDHVQVASGDSSQVTAATVSANTMSGDTPGAIGQGVTISAAGLPWSGLLRFDVSGNLIEGAQGSAVTVSGSGTGAATTFSGRVRDNVIGTGAPYSCSRTGHGIDVTNQGGAGALTTTVSGNTLRRCADIGINVDAGDGASTVNATVTGNQVLDLADVDLGQQRPRHGFFANLGIAAADTGTSCLDVRGNTFAGGAYGHGLRVWHRYATLRLPSYSGAPTDGAAVTAYLAGLNAVTTSSGLAPVIASTPVGGTYAGGAAACPTP
ncbi:cadherin domain-containing protein [Nocardioides pacificus]